MGNTEIINPKSNTPQYFEPFLLKISKTRAQLSKSFELLESFMPKRKLLIINIFRE
jgi:hypothetical protein